MSPLATLAQLVRENTDIYVAGTAKILQTDGSSSARHNAVELLLFHLAEVLASQQTDRLERWAQREAHASSADAIAQMLHAACFAVLASIEGDARLFHAALVRFEFIERRIGDVVREVARSRSGVRVLSAREGARTALLAFAGMLDARALARARDNARIAERLAVDCGVGANVVRDVRDSVLLLALDEVGGDSRGSTAFEVASSVPPLADIARTFAASRRIELHARASVRLAWSREPAAVLVWAAEHVLRGGRDAIVAFSASDEAALLPKALRGALRRLIADRVVATADARAAEERRNEAIGAAV